MPDTSQLSELLVRNEHNGVYHLPASGRPTLERAARQDGIPFFSCDLNGNPDAAHALTVLGDELRFPSTYGHNFDALHDYLTDLSWQEQPGAVLLLSGCDEMVSQAPETFTTLVEVCSAAAEHWRQADTPFWVFIDMKANGLAPLPTVA